MKFLKWTLITIVILIVAFSAVVAVKQNDTYDAPYPPIKASNDSAVIAKGKYLFFGPAHCNDCHANFTAYPKGTPLETMAPAGGLRFDLPIGALYTPNITSDAETGIQKLTDEEIARTLRYGVGSDGRAVLDFMPFHNTSDEDLTAIISYLRTIPPVKNKVPAMEYNLLGRVVKAFMLKPTGPDGEVPKSVQPGPTVEYGKYLAHNVANCYGCHTDRDMMTGAFIGAPFAGGPKLDIPGKPGLFFVPRNLTPDPRTGHIFKWSEEDFIARFRQGKKYPDSPMPWEPFGKMSDDDLKAIYRYLRSVPPVLRDPGPVIVMEKS
jgi:mono/diheme cytochrome c family protein